MRIRPRHVIVFIILASCSNMAMSQQDVWRGYDTSHLVSFKGTAAGLEQLNPTARLRFSVTNQDGSKYQVIGELPSANALSRMGWFVRAFSGPSGVVEIEGYRPKDTQQYGSYYIRVTRAVLPNGHVLPGFRPPKGAASASAKERTTQTKSSQESTPKFSEASANPEVFGIALGATEEDALAELRKRAPKLSSGGPTHDLTFLAGLGGAYAVVDADSYCVSHYGVDSNALKRLKCQSLNFRRVLAGNQVQTVVAILIRGKVVAVSFTHSRGKNRFGFDPEKMVREKYGSPGRVRTTLGSATLAFSQKRDPKTKEVTTYRIVLSLDRESVRRQFLQPPPKAKAARRVISAPPL